MRERALPMWHITIPKSVRRTPSSRTRGARIMMQPIEGHGFAPTGEAFPFLPQSFCPDEECDYGHMAISHGGDRMVFTGEDRDPRQQYTGVDHTGFVDDEDIALFQAVIDTGFPCMARCDDATIPSGPNAGEYWGDPVSSPYP
ncbi:MAG: hypothetical protein ACNA8W_23120 [Bradymonadaceae bacterium]